MNRLPIIDLHSDYVMACYKKGEPFESHLQTNYQMIRNNYVKTIFAGFSYDDYFKDTDQQLQILIKEVKKKRFKLILNKNDFLQVIQSPYLTGMILHLEGAKILNAGIELLEKYYDKGVRSLGLTHSQKNKLAYGNNEDPKKGITNLGKKIIKTALKKRMMVDLAHLNYQGFYDAAKLIDKPLFVSHANAYKICPNPRNLKDDQIKLIAASKGVIGIFFSAKYISKKIKPNLEDVADHFDYIAKLVGVEVLAIGSDFGGITTGLPLGLENVNKLKTLFEYLKKRGFNQNEIEKIAYKNALRVIKAYL